MSFLVVDDEELIARAMRKLLAPFGEVAVASTASNAREVLATRSAWRAFFIDLRLPDGSGLEVLARARVDHPSTPAMILTGFLDPEALKATFDLNADYMCKPIDRPRIARFLSMRADFSTRLQQAIEEWRKRYALTRTEADILRSAADGQSREAIAMARRCSEMTIKTHSANLLRKTGDASLAAAAMRLLRVAAGDPCET